MHLGSQSLLLATTTAMVVSSTVLFLAFSRQRPDQEPEPQAEQQPLRSCLCSSGDDGRKKGRKKTKKKVKFADSVKEPSGNGAEFREKVERMMRRNNRRSSCRDEMTHDGDGVMPANRAALYSGILRDRASRMACSH